MGGMSLNYCLVTAKSYDKFSFDCMQEQKRPQSSTWKQ